MALEDTGNHHRSRTKQVDISQNRLETGVAILTTCPLNRGRSGLLLVTKKADLLIMGKE